MHLPAWARIGCRGALAYLLIHVILAVRIWFGLMDPIEVKKLRLRDGEVVYYQHSYTEPMAFLEKLSVGLRGRSCSDVWLVNFHESGDDEALALIAATIPNVHSVGMLGTHISELGIRELIHCRQLSALGLCWSSVDDSAVAPLSDFENLSELNLKGTCITEAALYHLQRIPRLSRIDLSYTEVGLAAIKSWRANHPNVQIDTEKDQVIGGILGSVRWLDGIRKRQVFGNCRWGFCRSISGALEERSSISSHKDAFLYWSPHLFRKCSDGDYFLTLKVEEFEGEPIPFQISGGIPSIDSAEFRFLVDEPFFKTKSPRYSSR